MVFLFSFQFLIFQSEKLLKEKSPVDKIRLDFSFLSNCNIQEVKQHPLGRTTPAVSGVAESTTCFTTTSARLRSHGQ
jgi:hypothetical protein